MPRKGYDRRQGAEETREERLLRVQLKGCGSEEGGVGEANGWLGGVVLVEKGTHNLSPSVQYPNGLPVL